MIPRFVASLCLLAGVGVALSACSNPRKVLGLEIKAPDEFSVVERAPLSLPPDYALRPPEPGKSRPQERNPAERAQAAVLGSGGSTLLQGGRGDAKPGMTQAPMTQGEQALLKAAGADEAEPNIRQTVNHESSILAEEETSFTDRLVFWRTRDSSGTVVDARKEAKRIRNNQALGKPLSDGKTPTIERHKKALLEGIF